MNYRIIGFHGPKKSGKDTIASTFKNLIPNKVFIRVAFADEVKREVAVACKVDLKTIEENKDIFRPILQWWGTDFVRNFCKMPDHWINKWKKRVEYLFEHKENIIIVAPDVRFSNESDLIYSLGGVVYKIIPINSTYTYDDKHESEQELHFCESHCIRNDFKDKQKTINRIKELI